MTAQGGGSRSGDHRIDEALEQEWADLGDPSVLARLGSSLVDDKKKPTATPVEDADAAAPSYRVDGTPPPAPGRLPRR